MESKIDNGNEYDNKCGKCNTWSVGNNGGSYEMCLDNRERWFTNYYCENCNGDCSISEEDSWNKVEGGDTVYFD